MGIFLFSERKVYSNAVWRRDSQETSFPLLSHSQLVPKIDFPSHKLPKALKEVPLTEGNTSIHALEEGFKPRKHLLHAPNTTIFLEKLEQKRRDQKLWEVTLSV